MGAASSKPAQFESFLTNYQKRGDENDDRFGQISVYNHLHNPGEMIMVKERWTNTPPDAAELAGMSASRVQNNHRALAK